MQKRVQPRDGLAKAHTALSKKMSYLLRHHPPPEIGAGGFVPLPAVLRELGPAATEAVIRQIVTADSKGRFQLDDTTHPPRIRAVQGHSVEIMDLALTPLLDATLVPTAVHITSEDSWQHIQQSGELRRMSRTHIHFATEPRHLRRNSWATVLLQLDVQQAMEAGQELSLAANNVLLTVGPLPVQYVKRVRLDELPIEWQRQLRH